MNKSKLKNGMTRVFYIFKRVNKWKITLLISSFILTTIIVGSILYGKEQVNPLSSISTKDLNDGIALTSIKKAPVITTTAKVVIDGTISSGEYQVKETLEYNAGTGQAFWMHYTIDRSNGILYMAIHARALGWISIGFNLSSTTSMRYLDIIIGYHDTANGGTVIQDNYGDGTFSHSPDTSLGGTNDVNNSVAASSENSTDTIIEFKRALDTGDRYDFPIGPGTTTGLAWAYTVSSRDDDLTSTHDSTGVLTSYTFKAVPAAPQNLQASKVSGKLQVDLSWTAPTDDGGDPITEYRIYRSTTSGSGYSLLTTVPSSQTTYSDTSVNAGNTYYYMVAAVNSLGTGLNSTEVNVNVVDVPSAPQNLQASATSGSVTLTWDPPASDGGSQILLYKIYRSTTQGGSYTNIANTSDGTTTTYTDTSVVNGQTYYYVVSAVNSIGEGPTSTEASATPTGPPSAPQNLAGQGGVGWVYLTWQPPTNDGGSAITQYLIYRSTTAGGPYTTNIANVSASVTNYNDTSVTSGSTYYYIVKAENALGVGPASNEVKVTAGAVPGAPQNVTTRHGNEWIYITWESPSDQGGSPIKYYLVYRSNQSGSGYVQVANITAGSTLAYNDTGLVNGQTYYYVITAVNDDGEGSYSQEVSDKPGTKPDPPSNLHVLRVGDQNVTLSWTVPTNDGGYGIIEYKIYRSDTSGGLHILVGNTSVTSFTDVNLTNGQTYYYVVTAVNAEGESAYSEEVNATPMTVPDAPINFTAQVGDGFVYLIWSPPSDNGGAPISHYMIYRNTSGGNFEIIGNITETSYNDTTVTTGKSYQYYVVAVNVMGTGKASTIVTVTISAADNDGGTTTTTTTTASTTGEATDTSEATTPTASGTGTEEIESPQPDILGPEFVATVTLAILFLSALLAPFAIGLIRRMQE